MNGHHQDPGWPRGAQLLRLFPPFSLVQAFHIDGGRASILHLRFLWLSFVTTTLFILVAVVFVVPAEVTGTGEPLPWILLGAGAVAGLGGPIYARRRELDCGPPSRLAVQYRTWFLIAVTLAQSAALLGFVAAFTIDALWPYLVGMATSTVGFALVAPTTSRIAAVERELQTAGCPHSLTAGLFGTPVSE